MKDHFEEIIGYEDIKKELRIISDMLNNPDIYRNLGAEIKDGLMLIGRAGTGKTTMANCLIRSTNRKPYIIRKKGSDGEFIEEIIEIFEKAKANAPSIVLLDDFDKFSDQEDTNDSEEFVAVQACMDETSIADVYVIATVNKGYKIPDSLMRAGRFGHRLKIRIPEKDESVEIIKHYLKKVGISDGMDEKSIARILDGESCAALESVINNAAVKAAFKRQDKVTMKDIVDSSLDLIFDAPESCDQLSDETKRRIAYHEAGHALAAEILDPGSVNIISIRKTDDGDYGFVRYSRSKEKCDTSAEYNENNIKTSLAGKAATELVFGEADVGVNADIHNAFSNAKWLVDNVCMHGFHNWIEDDHDVVSAENRNRSMVMILERNYLEVKKILVEHRDLLDRIAENLMQKTTLIYSDIQELCS